jgi:hypothetical protein
MLADPSASQFQAISAVQTAFNPLERFACLRVFIFLVCIRQTVLGGHPAFGGF